MGGTGSGRTAKPKIKKLIKDLIPVGDVFEPAELEMYNDILEVYLSDFDADDLTSGDMDDIVNLAMNRVLYFRLLKGTKEDPEKQLDIANAIEKLDKRNEKIKESLSSRRRDRIDPNELKGFSIVDLAVAYDLDTKRKQSERLNRLREEEKGILEKRKDYVGNRYDISEATEGED
jgi:hypothetical protein